MRRVLRCKKFEFKSFLCEKVFGISLKDEQKEAVSAKLGWSAGLSSNSFLWTVKTKNYEQILIFLFQFPGKFNCTNY